MSLVNVHLAEATFPFTGTDEDELCFQKGDIIEVTKVVDGGWWEGTLNGRSGWFPSNHVTDVSSSPEPSSNQSPVQTKPDDPPEKRESIRVYHNLVLQNILDTEKAYVQELQALMKDYLKPLQESTVIPSDESKILCGNIEGIVNFQETLYDQLNEVSEQPLTQQRMGAVFLHAAPKMKEFYIKYCANHPQAVDVLTKYGDELSKFMEEQGAVAPGVLSLTTSLSTFFRRLDKYPTLLKELERHLEDGHDDEFDTKKAIAVFQNIGTSCREMRRRKETEHEILTGTIEGWEKEEMKKLGELGYMSSLLIHGEDGEVKERQFLLFPSVLVLLSVSEKLSGYCYETSYNVSDIKIRSLEDNEGILNALEIQANDQTLKVSANSEKEKSAWLECLASGPNSPLITSPLASSPEKFPTKEPMSPVMSPKEDPISAEAFKKSEHVPLKIVQSHTLPRTETSTGTALPRSVAALTDANCHNMPSQYLQRERRWDSTHLRPTPPLRPAFALNMKEDSTSSAKSVKTLLQSSRGKKGRSKSEEDYRQSHSSSSGRVLEEDMLILSVIESYCKSAKERYTVICSPIPPEVPPHRHYSMSTIKEREHAKQKKKKKFSKEIIGNFGSEGAGTKTANWSKEDRKSVA